MISFMRAIGALRKLERPLSRKARRVPRPALLAPRNSTPWKAPPSNAPRPGYRASPGAPLRCRPTPSPCGRWSVLCVVAVVGFFTWVTYPNYDSYYSLLWGARSSTATCRASRPTARPPSTRSRSRSAPCCRVLGQSADRVMVLFTLFSFVALVGRHVQAGAARLHAVRRRDRGVPGADPLRLPVARGARATSTSRSWRRSCGRARWRPRGPAAARRCSCCSPRRA